MDLSVLPPPPRIDDVLVVPTLDPVLREAASDLPNSTQQAYATVGSEPARTTCTTIGSTDILPTFAVQRAQDPRRGKLASAPPPPALPPPPEKSAVVAYLASDGVLLTPNLRVSMRGYNRRDVEQALDGMRKRIVIMRADLERAQSAQRTADEIVTEARLTAAEMLADASIEANRLLDDASTTSQKLLAETQVRCQTAARRGISAAFEMAGVLGYTDTREERFDEEAEQEAFEQFFAGDENSTDRDWMVAS